MNMDLFDEEIDAERYRINIDDFEVVNRDEEPYPDIETLLITPRDDHLNKYTLDSSDRDWKRRVVNTIALDLSDHDYQTVPLFNIPLPAPDGFRKPSNRKPSRGGNRSAYMDHLRSFFVDEDSQDRIRGLGPIGKCLKLSQEQEVVLHLEGIHRVPGKAQSIFFEVLEKPQSMQYVQTLEGKTENMNIVTTLDSTSQKEKFDRKLQTLLGPRFSDD